MAREVNFDIVAKDKASDTLDDVAKQAAKVEKLDPTVDVKADASAAKHTLDGMGDQLDKLTDADKLVVLSLRAGAAKAELTDLATDLATIDASDPDVDVTFDRFKEVSGQLDQIEAQMTDISTTSLDPDVGDTARNKLAGIGAEAGKTQDAVHSMAGNALGDFAATTTGIGPLGEAIGQLTEQATAGEAVLKDLATAGLGLGAVAGAMVIVNLAMKSFADAAERARKIKAFDDDSVKAFTQSLNDGTDVTDDYIARLKELGKVSANVIPDVASDALNRALRNTVDLTAMLAKAGITAEEFGQGVTGSAADLQRFIDGVHATNLSLEQQALIVSGATSEFNNMAAAKGEHAKFVGVFGQETQQIKLFSDATQGMRNDLAGADKAALGLGTRIGKAADKTDDLTDAYTALSAEISSDQSMIDLADQIDAVTDAGNTAIQAQKDADTARRQGAKDATDQQRAAEQAMRDYQTAVNQTKEDIIKIAETAKVSPVELKATLDKVDQGDLAGAKADAEAWSKRNPVQLQAELDIQKLLRQIPIIGGLLKFSGQSATAAPTTVNQFLAAPDARRAAAQVARTARVNGR